MQRVLVIWCFVCKVSLLCSALCAKCPYYGVLYGHDIALCALTQGVAVEDDFPLCVDVVACAPVVRESPLVRVWHLCTCGNVSTRTFQRECLAEIPVLVGVAILPVPAVPASTRICAKLKRVQEHSSPVSIDVRRSPVHA